MSSSPHQTSEQTADAAPLTPEEFRVLARRIHRNAHRAAALFGFAIYSVLIAIIIAAFWSIIVGAMLSVGSVMLYGAILALALYMFTIKARKDNPHIERLLKFINSTQDADMLGPIFDLENTSMHPGDIYSRIKEDIEAAVLRLLPCVQPHHANVLNQEKRLRIHYRIWKISTQSSFYSEERGLHNLPYARGALHALEQIGDKNDLPHIESLLRAVNTTEEFRAAVKHCLDVVRERAAREEGKDVLLRPERKPEASDTLLRPSIEQTNMQPEQLLRGAAADERNPSV